VKNEKAGLAVQKKNQKNMCNVHNIILHIIINYYAIYNNMACLTSCRYVIKLSKTFIIKIALVVH